MISFVGLSWWGVGVSEMADATSDSTPVILWNLRSRRDRLLMRSPAQYLVAGQRLRRAFQNRTFATSFIVSPHRLSAPMWSLVRERSEHVVALLGDEPVGQRALCPELIENVDTVAVADISWADAVGSTIPVVEAPWRSTITDEELLGAPMNRPLRVAFVGTPYPERVEFASRLSERLEILTVGNWPQLRGVVAHPPKSREATIRLLRRERAMTINVLHPQFRGGLNPQFFDYLACGVPQILVDGRNFDMWVPSSSGDALIRVDESNMLDVAYEANRRLLSEYTPQSLRFSTTIERLLLK